MAVESFNKEFKLNSQEQVDQFLEILERHKDKNENSYDFLREWIDSYIRELEGIKTDIIIQKTVSNKGNKDAIIKSIQKVFKIMNNFEYQKKLYEKFKEEN